MGANDLPVASSTQIVRGFEKLGWKSRRGKRNHFVLTHPRKPNVHLTIPDHNEVDRFILHSHIKQAGLTVDQFNVAFQSIGKAAGKIVDSPSLGDTQHCPLCDTPDAMILGRGRTDVEALEWVCIECSERLPFGPHAATQL